MTEAADRPQPRRFSVAHLALLLPWVVIVIGAWEPIQDNSFLWHVRAGTVQAQDGAVLTADPFSFTMQGEPWQTQSWLAELNYGWLEGLTGLEFVPYMLLIIPLLTFVTIGLIAYYRSKSVPATTFVIVLSILALVSFLVPRPVIFSYLLMALAVLAWDRPSTRWTVPFVFWIWAGVHASFVLGLAYIAFSVIMNREWRELSKAVVAGVVTLGTAHGLGIVRFLLDFGSNNDALQYLVEWRQPQLMETLFLPFLGGVVFVVVGAFRERIFPRHLWLIVPVVLIGMSSVRAIPAAWILLIPLVATSLFGLEIGSRPSQRLHHAAIFGTFVLVFPFFLISDSGLDETRFPLSAVEHLDDGRTLHDDVVGGYLIWAESPERLVYIDDRAELYGARMEEFVKMRRGELHWKPILEKDNIQQVLLSRDEPLVEDLTDGGWSVTYYDQQFTILKP